MPFLSLQIRFLIIIKKSLFPTGTVIVVIVAYIVPLRNLLICCVCPDIAWEVYYGYNFSCPLKILVSH